MGCIHTSNSNKSRITIRVKELKYYIDIFNQSIICHVQGLEAIRHLSCLRVRGNSRYLPVRGDSSFAAFNNILSIEGYLRHRGGKSEQRPPMAVPTIKVLTN